MNQTAPAASSTVRRLGGVLAFLGLALVLGVGWLLLWMAPMLLHPGSYMGDNRFNGTPEEARMVFLLIAGVFAFGWVAFFYGTWQLVTGRRSLLGVGVLLAVAGALYLGAMMVAGALG